MSRRKQVNFVDAADIYLDTASPAAVRDMAVMVSTYARVRKLPFKVTITDVQNPPAQDELKLVEGKK